MGIRGLKTYLEQNCPNAQYSVDLGDLVRQWREENPREAGNPTMVVDLLACFRKWYGDLDWLCGGQFREFLARVHAFVDSCRLVGLEPVVFVDGPVVDLKRHAWVDRAVRRLNDIEKVFDVVEKHGKWVMTEDDNIHMPCGIPNMTRYVLSEVCHVRMITSTTNECDSDIAAFARTEGNRCVAILSNDTDFLALNIGRSVYVHVDTLHESSMTAKAYDRSAVWNHFGLLLPAQVPLFATLVGNDFLTRDQLSSFHSRVIPAAVDVDDVRLVVARFSFKVIKHVAKYVAAIDGNMSRMPDVLASSVSDNANVQQLIQRSVRFYAAADGYATPGLPIETRAPVAAANEKRLQWRHVLRMALEKLQRCHLSTFCYSVITEQMSDCGSRVEDFRKTDLKPAGFIYRQLQRHIYWVLLKDLPAANGVGEQVNVKEWCVLPDMDPFKPVPIAPIAIPNDGKQSVPHLVQLWTDRRAEMNDLRMRLLLGALLRGNRKKAKNESGITAETVSLLNKIPEEIVLPALTLLYLNNCCPSVLKDWEVNSLLCTALFLYQLPPFTTNSFSFPPPPRVSTRAVRLATVFLIGVETVSKLIESLGSPFEQKSMQPFLFFDGTLFQYFYNKMSSVGATKQLDFVALHAEARAKFTRKKSSNDSHATIQLSGQCEQVMETVLKLVQLGGVERTTATKSKTATQRDDDNNNLIGVRRASSAADCLDASDPQTKAEFRVFASLLSNKIRSLDTSPHYEQLCQQLIADICKPLSAAKTKKVMLGVDSLVEKADKVKAREAKTKKKQ